MYPLQKLATLIAAGLFVIVAIVVATSGRARRQSGPLLYGTGVVGCAGGELRAMSYNLLGGGLDGGQPLSQSAAVIRRVDPHVIGIQEPVYEGANKLAELADLVGMRAVHEANLITALPAKRAWRVAGNGAAELVMPDGRSVFVYNIHLQSNPYGPHAVRDGDATTAEQAVAVEEPRVREIETVLEDMARNVPAEGKVILMGDFNCPSHRDWPTPTPRTYNLSVPWPVTILVEAAGFVDTFRILYPNAVSRDSPLGTSVPAKAGFTYSPVVRDDNDHLPSDRIDMIFARGPRLRICESFVIGESGEYSDVAVEPWPSDHRAVVAHLAWD